MKSIIQANKRATVGGVERMAKIKMRDSGITVVVVNIKKEIRDRLAGTKHQIKLKAQKLTTSEKTYVAQVIGM